MSKEVVLTGLRSNAEFHLGNYLGAILSVVELQKKHADQYQINMFIPDLHSFTTPIEHANLYEQSLKNVKVFVAAGLDIDNPDTFIYRQSYIPAHSELTWILDCFTGFGELNRMTQFKEKSKKIDIQKIQEEMLDVTGALFMMRKQGQLDNDALKRAERAIENSMQILVLNDRLPEFATVGIFNYPALMAADILLYGAKWVPVGEISASTLNLLAT